MMEMDDSKLWDCNETELLQMARSTGNGCLRRGLPQETLIQIVSGEIAPAQEHVSPSDFTRVKLQLFLTTNYGRAASQLPGCTGQCTIYPCSDGEHVLCFSPNKDVAT